MTHQPHHHVPESLLFEYAAGACSEGEALLVAVHCALCPTCRVQVEALQAIGGELFEELEPAALDADAEARILAALDEPVPQPAARPDPDGVLPRPLVDLVGPASQLPWRFKVPGIKQCDIPVSHGSVPVQLFRLSAGLRIPRHQHQGTERTLVLTGGFTDNAGSYARGDVAIYGEGWDHVQTIDPGEPCIALVVNDGKLLPRTLLGRVVSLLVGSA